MLKDTIAIWENYFGPDGVIAKKASTASSGGRGAMKAGAKGPAAWAGGGCDGSSGGGDRRVAPFVREPSL